MLILDKVGLDFRIFTFFSNYFIKKIQYIWNNFTLSFFRVDIDIDQGSALFSILFTLYFSFSFVNGSFFISQEKSYDKFNKLEVSYFSKSINIFNFLFLNLRLLEGLFLWPKKKWRYLRFIFDRKLFFVNIFTFILTKSCWSLRV